MTDHLHAAGQNQEDFQIESEEKPSNEAAEAAAHSPVVGEKRLRDEDDSEHRREAPSDGGGTPGFRSESSPAPGQNSNGAYSGQTGNTNTNTAGSGVGGAGSGQHDALYIGDLQWVCILVFSSSHVCRISETISICDAHLHVPLCCPTLSFNSGRLMRICGKSRSALGSTLTTRTSRSRSIR